MRPLCTSEVRARDVVRGCSGSIHLIDVQSLTRTLDDQSVGECQDLCGS